MKYTVSVEVANEVKVNTFSKKSEAWDFFYAMQAEEMRNGYEWLQRTEDGCYVSTKNTDTHMVLSCPKRG